MTPFYGYQKNRPLYQSLSRSCNFSEGISEQKEKKRQTHETKITKNRHNGLQIKYIRSIVNTNL